MCSVTATDAYGGTAGSSALATVINSDPTITATTIVPSNNVTVNDLLTCGASGTDLNDGALSVVYAWSSTNGSTATGATWQLSSSIVGAGDTITCTSTVVDSNGGSASSSNSVTIQNTACFWRGIDSSYRVYTLVVY